jgi:hypothetical protein
MAGNWTVPANQRRAEDPIHTHVKNDAPQHQIYRPTLNTTQMPRNCTIHHAFLHVFAAKKSHFQLSKPEEITWKTKSDPETPPKLTTTNYKYQRLFLSTADWSVLTY